MTYLLIIPSSVYIALATLVLYRQPRSLTHQVLAAYCASAALATGAYVVLGTTPFPGTARTAAILVIVSSSAAYMVLMPLTLISLYFESWFAIHHRRVLLLAFVAQASLLPVAFILLNPNDLPLAVPLDAHHWQHWLLVETGRAWPLGALMLFGSQVPSVAAIAAALHYRRLSLWRGALTLTLANVLSVLLPLLAPLAGTQWIVFITALGYLPPVTLYTLLLIRVAWLAPLNLLVDSTFQRYNEGLIVLDADDAVVWHNAKAAQWLPWSPTNLAPQPIRQLLHGSLLLAPVQQLLRQQTKVAECEWVEGEREIVLRLELHPLENVRYLPGARLLALRDITDTRVLMNLHAQREELLALSAISADIASSLDLDQVITRALQQTQAVVNADTAVVYLLDPDNPHQFMRAGQIIRDPLRHNGREAPPTLSIEGTTAGWVVQNAKPFFTPHAGDDQRMARLQSYGLHAGATVPLMARNRVIGVLQMGMHTRREFDPVTIALIESVGQQLGVAIDNARLHHQERHQRRVAEVLSSIAGILTTQSLDQALQALLDQLQALLDYERASILLLEGDGQLSISAYAGFENVPPDGSLANVRITIADYPYLQALFDQRQPQIVPDTTQDERWMQGEYHFNSWIGVPLIIHNQVWGCLNIGHSEPGYFNKNHFQIATTFADQAVIAVENARLFESEQRRRRHAEFLQHASYELVTSPDIDSALFTALARLAQVCEFDRARIGLLDGNRRMYVTRVSYPANKPPQHNKALPVDYYPLVAKLITERKPIYIPETRDEPLWIPEPPETSEIRSWIGVPLMVRDDLIGLLNLYCYRPHNFTPEQLDISRMFANQTAAALENFRLLDEAERRNRTLSALNTVLAASNEALAARDDVLKVSLARVLDTLDLPGGAIHQLDSGGHWLQLRAAAGMPNATLAQLQRVPVTGDINTLALPAIVDATGATLAAFFSVPLTASGRGIGLLSMLWPPGEPVPDDLRALLSNIGQQLGVVMDNAILFEATTRRAALSTDLNRLSLAISAQLDRDTVLNLLCDESIGVFDVQGAYIWLVHGEELVGAAASGPGADMFIGHRIALADSHLLPAQVIEQWRPQYAHHLTPSSGSLPADFIRMTRACAALAVPLLKADVPIGVLLLVNTQVPDAFGRWPLDQIGVLGVQAALAIQNANLFNEVRRRLDQLRLVHEASRYATALLSLTPLIEGVTRKIARSLGYDLVSLIEVTPDTPTIHTVFYRETPLPEAMIAPLAAPLLQQAERAIHQVSPVQQNARYLLPRALRPDYDCEEVIFCVLAVPMIIADEVTGVLLVARQTTGSITAEDLDVLNPLAAQLAISVSNARLYEKVRQQTIALEARVAQRTEEIRRQHERTEAILRSVADAVIVFDLQAQVVMTNPVARALFDKHDLDMDLGTHVRGMVTPILSGDHSGHDSTAIFEAGPVTLQAKAAPVVEGEQTLGAVVVMRDITRLRELDRMKDMFVSNVSHELRTPLANLKLYQSLLEQGHPERRAKYRDVMRREIERLERLISDLLQISRLKSEQRADHKATHEPLDLDQLIETVIERNSALAHSENKTLHYAPECASLPQVIGNPDQLFRALTNLVSNAVRYTPEGGSVLVRSRTDNTPGQTEAEWVIIEVADTGIGIPAQELGAIFDRFYRGTNVSPTISGTGLGLAIVKEIIDLHEGRIDVESEEGHGSTFRVALRGCAPQTSSETLVETEQ